MIGESGRSSWWLSADTDECRESLSDLVFVPSPSSLLAASSPVFVTGSTSSSRPLSGAGVLFPSWVVPVSGAALAAFSSSLIFAMSSSSSSSCLSSVENAACSAETRAGVGRLNRFSENSTAHGSGEGCRNSERELLLRDMVLAGGRPGETAAGHEGLCIPRLPSRALGAGASCVWLEFGPFSPPHPPQIELDAAAGVGNARPGSADAQSLKPSSSTAHGDAVEKERCLVRVRLGSSRVERGMVGSRFVLVSVAHGEPHGSSMLPRTLSHVAGHYKLVIGDL